MRIGPFEILYHGGGWRRDVRKWLSSGFPKGSVYDHRNMADVGVKIRAIRDLRNKYGFGLKESKEKVESVMMKMRIL